MNRLSIIILKKFGELVKYAKRNKVLLKLKGSILLLRI